MVLRKPTLNELNYECANLIFQEIQQIRQEKGIVVIGLPGGRSTAGIYKIFKEQDFDWRNIHFFLVDERLVPIDHKDSNYKVIMESFGNDLLATGKITPNQLHPYRLENTLDQYTKELEKLGGFDILLLGVGEDGHCAALFPNHPSILNEEEGFIAMKDSPKPPPERMTASRKTLLKAKVGFAFFIGESKLDALKQFLNKNIKIEQCPIKLVSFLPKHYEATDLRWMN
jgi:6-phosphogluconolactonase